MTLLRVLFSTSMTCKTSPAAVPNKRAFSTMKSCSFSVVQSIRHVAEREPPVVTVSLPSTAKASMASTMEARLGGSRWVLRPRSWSEMSERRWRLADWDWAVREEEEEQVVILVWRCLGEFGFWGLEGMGRRRHVAMVRSVKEVALSLWMNGWVLFLLTGKILAVQT